VAEACCREVYQKALRRAHDDTQTLLGFITSQPLASTFLSPNQHEPALTWARTEENAELWRSVDQARQRGRITLRACYCSVFDECWIAETNKFPPRPVRNCPPIAEPTGQ
jgi:hypothetical protein